MVEEPVAAEPIGATPAHGRRWGFALGATCVGLVVFIWGGFASLNPVAPLFMLMDIVSGHESPTFTSGNKVAISIMVAVGASAFLQLPWAMFLWAGRHVPVQSKEPHRLAFVLPFVGILAASILLAFANDGLDHQPPLPIRARFFLRLALGVAAAAFIAGAVLLGRERAWSAAVPMALAAGPATSFVAATATLYATDGIGFVFLLFFGSQLVLMTMYMLLVLRTVPGHINIRRTFAGILLGVLLGIILASAFILATIPYQVEQSIEAHEEPAPAFAVVAILLLALAARRRIRT